MVGGIAMDRINERLQQLEEEINAQLQDSIVTT